MSPDAEPVIDESGDESDPEDEEIFEPFSLPEGFQVAEPPSESELEFRNSEGAKLVGRMVLYCWPDVGWCKGKIISVNTDGRFKVGGANVNFIIYYEVDDDNSKHTLSLAAFGEDKDWVLLEKA